MLNLSRDELSLTILSQFSKLSYNVDEAVTELSLFYGLAVVQFFDL